MENYVYGPEMPMGLGMALAQNLVAMDRFAAMTEAQKRTIIEGTHQIQSRKDMQLFVQQIAEGKL